MLVRLVAFSLAVSGIASLSLDAAAQNEVFPAVPWSVHLLAPDGAPAGKQRLMWACYEENGKSEFMMSGGGDTDDVGWLRWAQTGLPAGRYKIACLVPGQGYSNPELVLSNNTPAIQVECRLKRGGAIAGRVLEEGTEQAVGGEILQPMNLEINQAPDWNSMLLMIHRYSRFPTRIYPDSTTISISADGDGRFVVQCLPPGRYQLKPLFDQAWAWGSSPWHAEPIFTLGEGEVITNANIVVPRTAQARNVVGRVFEEDGKTPLPHAHLRVRLSLAQDAGKHGFEARTPEMERTVQTDAKGGFRLYPLKPNDYLMTVLAPGDQSSDVVPVSLSTNVFKNLEFILRPKG